MGAAAPPKESRHVTQEMRAQLPLQELESTTGWELGYGRHGGDPSAFPETE